MSNITVTKQSSSLPMAPEQVDILRKTLFKGFNDDEIAFSLAVCTRTGLDPFLRQVHFTKRKNKDGGEETVVITTGIDGLRLMAARTGLYAGSDEPELKANEKGELVESKVTVWKFVQGARCAFTGVARWDEFYPGDKLGFMWKKMPSVMLSKCVEAQALRKAFPAELHGIYEKDEVNNNERPVRATKAKELTQAVQETTGAPEFESAPYFEENNQIDGEENEPAVSSLGEYVIKVGQQFKGKRLKDVPDAKLGQFVAWVDGLGEKAPPDVVECKDKIVEYLMEGKDGA